jgi:ABC-2 type transport system ATP-binding protein
VISNRLHTGRTVIHVLADRLPEEGFEPVTAGLEDLYFATLTEHRRRPAAA